MRQTHVHSERVHRADVEEAVDQDLSRGHRALWSNRIFSCGQRAHQLLVTYSSSITPASCTNMHPAVLRSDSSWAGIPSLTEGVCRI